MGTELLAKRRLSCWPLRRSIRKFWWILYRLLVRLERQGGPTGPRKQGSSRPPKPPNPMERVYHSRYRMTFRPGLILSWCLVVSVRSVYAPPPQSGRTIQRTSASLPFRCSARFRLTSGLWAPPAPLYPGSGISTTTAALPPAVRKGSAFPGPGAPNSRAAAPPHRRQKSLSTSRPGIASLSKQPDQWVRAQVNALVKAARAAYEKDEAQHAYDRVLDGIVRTIRLRKLSENPDFRSQYPEFLEYINAVSIDRR